MVRIVLVAASTAILLAATGSALAGVNVQGVYAMQLNKSCLSGSGPSTTAEYGQASFKLSTKALTIAGFEDTITPSSTYGTETTVSTVEPYSYTDTTLTLGLFVFHAYYKAVVKGIATTVLFGGVDPAGCIETGTLVQ